jgi:RNA polymerase sigma-70 factor (ECF subfamily)
MSQSTVEGSAADSSHAAALSAPSYAVASLQAQERSGKNTMGSAMSNATHLRDTQQIWAEFGDRLRAFIARRVDSDADADDILQDVFLRIHRHADSVERHERLVSWLFQVTRNAIADYYRAPMRRRELPSGAGYDLEGGQDHAWGGGDDGDAAFLEARFELAVCLRPMIEQLPPLYREAVTLVDLEGVPQHEAAARAGLSHSGMKSRVQRGRQALEHLLHDCCRIELDTGGRVTEYQPRGAGCGPCGQECQ